jgi:hypothetical protein
MLWHVDKGSYMIPENFSRIIHDYSEERKGFVLWRDMLEERLL